MKTNPRRQTFEESGVTLIPPKSFPSPKNLCRHSGEYDHSYKLYLDGSGATYKACIRCGNLPLRWITYKYQYVSAK